MSKQQRFRLVHNGEALEETGKVWAYDQDENSLIAELPEANAVGYQLREVGTIDAEALCRRIEQVEFVNELDPNGDEMLVESVDLWRIIDELTVKERGK